MDRGVADALVEIVLGLGAKDGLVGRADGAEHPVKPEHRPFAALARGLMVEIVERKGDVRGHAFEQRDDLLIERMGLAPGDQATLTDAMHTIERLLGTQPETKTPYLLRLHQPGDMGWVIHRHGALYAQEFGWDERFEALVAEVAAKFIQKFDSKRERCWIAEKDGGIVGSASGRYFAGVIGGALPAALAADWLAAAWDQNAVLYATGPAAAIAEEAIGAWLKEIFGLPEGASFALVTWCQMAHATCLAAARHALLRKRGWDVEQRGLFGAPPIRILSGQERHGSTGRAIRLLGLGLDQVLDLPTDDAGQLSVDALEQALAAHPDSPAIVSRPCRRPRIGSWPRS